MRYPKFSSSLVSAIPLALATALLFCAQSQAATNVLGNPGFETGNFNSWTPYGNRAVESTNATYYNGGNPGGSNVLTHGGIYVGKTFGLFSGSDNFNGAYQDAVAGPGSVWSAGGYALSHQQDLIQPGIRFWLEVTFRGAGNEILAMYKSYTLDPGSPEGVTSNVWYSLAVTNQIDISDPSYQTITNTVSSFSAPAGTTAVRYQIVHAQQGFAGGSVYFDDLNLTKIAGTDPDITSSPVSRIKIVGQSVTFNVTAAGATALSYQWIKNATNNLANGGNISGATSSTLTISNLTIADAGSYSVRVTDTAGTLVSAPATLTVLTAVEANNYLSNPGLESGTFAPSWLSYNGAGIPVTPISVHSGTNAGQAYSAGPGSYNGFYQDVSTDDIHTVTAGSIFAADGWVYVPSTDQIGDGNSAWIETHFHDSNGNMIGLYKSAVITTNFPTDQWINLPVTNIIAFWSDYSVVGTAKYFTAPAGTAYVRYQTVFYAAPGGGGGSVLFDDMSLIPKNPVTIKVVRSGSNIQLSFATQAATTYEVSYKTNLTDPTWQFLTTVNGDGTVKTVSDPIGPTSRYYRVTTQ